MTDATTISMKSICDDVIGRKLSYWTDEIEYLVLCIDKLQMTTTENSK